MSFKVKVFWNTVGIQLSEQRFIENYLTGVKICWGGGTECTVQKSHDL